MFGWTTVSPATARAGFWENLSSALSFVANPRGDGARTGFYVVSYEPLMDGWRVDWGRSFGPDAIGRPNSLDFGPVDLTFNSGSLRWSAQFNRRLLPGADFDLFTPAPLDYTLTLNTGFQNATVEGQIDIASAGHINMLGFYDFELDVSNRGDFEIDGFFSEDDGDINFDIGPINVSGNIFADVLAAVTDPFFTAAGVDNPFTQFSQRATKQALYDATADALRERLAAGEILSDQEIESLIDATVLSAVLGGVEPDMSLLETALMRDSEQVAADKGLVATGGDIVPEPATVALLAAPLLARRWRRRS